MNSEFILVLAAAVHALGGVPASWTWHIPQALLAEPTELATAECLRRLDAEDPSVVKQALQELAPDGDGILAHYDILTEAAAIRNGPTIVEHIARAIRETAPGETKRRAIDRFLDYLVEMMTEDHPCIPAHEAVRRVVTTVYYPEQPDILPAYGASRVEEVLRGCLDHADYRVRQEAAEGLYVVGFTDPKRTQAIRTVLASYVGKEAAATDYPPDSGNLREQLLRKMGRHIERLDIVLEEARLGGGLSSDRESEEEYYSLKRMSTLELLEQVGKGGVRGSVALGLTTRGGCTPETVKSLVDIARKDGGKLALAIVDHVCGKLTAPSAEGTQTQDNRSAVEVFVRLLREDLCENSTRPGLGGMTALEGLSKLILSPSVLRAQDTRSSTGNQPDLDRGYELALQGLMEALRHRDPNVRCRSIDVLGHVARTFPSRAEMIRSALEECRDREEINGDSDQHERLLRALDAALRDIGGDK